MFPSLPLMETAHSVPPLYPYFPGKSFGMEVMVALEEESSDDQEDILLTRESQELPPPLSPALSPPTPASSISEERGRAQRSHCFQVTQLITAPTVCEAKTHSRALSQDRLSEPEVIMVPTHVLISYIACNILRHLRRDVTV